MRWSWTPEGLKNPARQDIETESAGGPMDSLKTELQELPGSGEAALRERERPAVGAPKLGRWLNIAVLAILGLGIGASLVEALVYKSQFDYHFWVSLLVLYGPLYVRRTYGAKWGWRAYWAVVALFGSIGAIVSDGHSIDLAIIMFILRFGYCLVSFLLSWLRDDDPYWKMKIRRP